MAKFKLLGKEILIGKDLSQYTGRSDDQFSILQPRYGADYTSKNRLQAYRNVVYACVSLIAEQCGSYEPILQVKNGDQWKTIDHEFMSLLHRPGGRDLKAASFSMFDLFEGTASYQLLQGDMFWYMALGKTTGKPREIVMLRPDKVGTDIDKNTGEVNGYFIRQLNGDPIPLEVEEVLRFPFFNPDDPYKGRGVVQAGSDYIATDEATASYTKNFFANNAGLSGVLNIKGEVTKGAFRKFVRAWRDKYEGVGNAGKVAILRDSDATFTGVGSSLDSLGMPDLRKMTLDDVLMMFKVPLPLLGKAEQTGLGRANVEALEYIFAKYNIDKKLLRFDSILQFALERYYGLDNRNYRVIHKSIIPDDKEFKLNERIAGVDKWLKRNEVRDMEGLDVVDGGDKLFIPIQQIPIDEAGTAPAPAATSTSAIRVKITRTVKKKDAKVDAERFRLALMRNQVRYEKLFRRTLKPILARQQKDVLANIAQHASSLSTKDFHLFDNSSYDDQITDGITPIMVDLAEVQGGLALVFAGDDDGEFLVTAPLQEIIRAGTAKMAGTVNDRILEELQNTLAQGVTAGESLSKLKQRVASVYDKLNGYQAERIARTETLKASNAATSWAYQQTGYVTGKQWSVNPDACPECAEFDGKTVPLDDSFLAMGDSYTYTDENGDEQTVVNTYDTVEEPPLHPNCRCTIIPVGD
jgi:HK97 family phage portal protein